MIFCATLGISKKVQYVADENFPKVVEQSFINSVLPTGIVDISYTVDLSGLKAVNLME